MRVPALSIAAFLLALASFPFARTCQAAPACATTVAELRALLTNESLALEWRETTMDDGKPLILTILDKDGALFLAFVKTGEGLWIEGASIVCRDRERLEARFVADRVRVGEAASWAMRYAFENGARFTLTQVGTEHLRIATTGWSGTFCPR